MVDALQIAGQSVPIAVLSVVVGVALAGYGPLAMAVAGLELIVVGVMMGAADGKGDADDPG